MTGKETRIFFFFFAQFLLELATEDICEGKED